MQYNLLSCVLIVSFVFFGQTSPAAQMLLQQPPATQVAKRLKRVAVPLLLAGGYAIHKLVQTACRLSEKHAPKIALDQSHADNKEKNDKPFATLFAHGHGGGIDHMNIYTGDYLPTSKNVPCQFLNKPEYKAKEFFKYSYLAQEGDIQILKASYEELQKDHNIILFGVSRGASVIRNFLGRYRASQVKAAVEESPFASLEDVTTHIVSKEADKIVPFPFVVKKVLGDIIASCAKIMFKGYSPYGIRPVDVAAKVDPELPILVVCSKEDDVIPASSSIKLYEKIKQAGHKKAHLLVLDHGQHAYITAGRDGLKYRNVLHAFYQKYNLPHTAEYAKAGEAHFAKTQP
ncbi:MAG TPA: hypothetical protein VGT41_00095 [Candidatus Babeliales bacterium]|nr:hypothetical protein [Candidatus Babeliales bacterium]